MKFFYSLFFLLFSVTMLAQTPGGISGSVLWLKGNTGASPSAWTDYSGLGNHFSQSTPANQPALNNNVFNFNAAFQFDGANTFMTQPTPASFPENNDDRTIFVVANATDITGYKWIFVYGTPGCTPCYSTFQVGNHDAGLSHAFYGNELTYPNYWNAPVNINGGLASFIMTSGTGIQYDRGSFLQSNFLGPLSATSVNGVIGALTPAPAENWAGSVGEVILFSSALSDVQRNQVESYLALKYGFTLGSTADPIDYTASDGVTIYWTGSATYQNDVFGIGTDNGTGLTQTISNSMNSGNGNGTGQTLKGNLVVSTGAPLSDMQFLVIGNDAAPLTEHTIATGEAAVIAEGSQRVLRNWTVQNTGSVGAVDLSFDTTGFTYAGGAIPGNFRLMIDQDGDGDYATGTPVFVKPSSFTGNQMNFTGVTFANNATFTIITQISLALPATWQGFSATLQKNKAILTWKTSDEINVDHYTVEYSADAITFVPAGTVAARNAAGVNTYSFSQDNLPAGIRYYRIKRVDKDGKIQYSDVKSVRAGGLTTVVLKSNPILKDKLELNIEVPQSQDAVIRVVSTSGIVLVLQHTGLATGTNAIKTNVAHIAAGTYFLQVQLANEIINKKFVKL